MLCLPGQQRAFTDTAYAICAFDVQFDIRGDQGIAGGLIGADGDIATIGQAQDEGIVGEFGVSASYPGERYGRLPQTIRAIISAAKLMKDNVFAMSRIVVDSNWTRSWCSPAGTSTSISPSGSENRTEVKWPSIYARQPSKKNVLNSAKNASGLSTVRRYSRGLKIASFIIAADGNDSSISWREMADSINGSGDGNCLTFTGKYSPVEVVPIVPNSLS